MLNTGPLIRAEVGGKDQPARFATLQAASEALKAASGALTAAVL